jgi:hypothetical protein
VGLSGISAERGKERIVRDENQGVRASKYVKCIDSTMNPIKYCLIKG